MTTKMPSESPALPAQTEKPNHYMYLKEFRTQQCPLFLQHKCTQHRPYTCFHWHFMNQRRRRPIRKRDGTFNYSPDVYCGKFDETTGMCPDGDECQFLHRTAGDTERRYHLRYYKTGTCVYETDVKGFCVKNGAHCAFAHGAMDLRPPVYDIRELQSIDTSDKSSSSPGTPSSGSLEKDRMLIEDPRWNDTNFVLANYKTEPCKRPPRLCRQGYACPQYHNTRDRRRSPKVMKYRSTPCPNVKHGDDWGDPVQCEGGDNCGYCHTRTEQQFHPEIYKSTKCNDMVQTGFCPRGPFCAFAHVERKYMYKDGEFFYMSLDSQVLHPVNEMTTQREISAVNMTSLGAMISNLLPSVSSSLSPSKAPSSLPSVLQTQSQETKSNGVVNITNKMPSSEVKDKTATPKMSVEAEKHMNGKGNTLPSPIGKERHNSLSNVAERNVNGKGNTLLSPIGKERTNSLSSAPTVISCGIYTTSNNNPHNSYSSMPEPIGKGRSSSTSSSITSDGSGIYYARAPGSEREDVQSKLRQQLQAIDNDQSIDATEKAKRKRNLVLLHNFNNVTSVSGLLNMPLSPNSPASGMSPFAPSFYPPGETVGSVIEQALEDITLDDIDINSLDKELDNDTNSLSSSISVGISSTGFGSSSVPIGIPPCSIQRGSVGSLSQSPPSPYGSFPHAPQAIMPSLQNMQSHKDSEQVSIMETVSELFEPVSISTSTWPMSTSNGGHKNAPFLGQHNHTKFSGSPFGDVNSMSPRSGPGGPHSPLYSHSLSSSQNSDVLKLQLDLNNCKTRLEHWEQAYSQAKSACEAWKKEAEESTRKMKSAEESAKGKEETLKKVKAESEALKMNSGSLRSLHRTTELDNMMLPQLRQLQQQLQGDLDKVVQVIYQQTALKCIICQDRKRSVATAPCNHCVMCDTCALTKTDCPMCRTQITQRNSVGYQL